MYHLFPRSAPIFRCPFQGFGTCCFGAENGKTWRAGSTALGSFWFLGRPWMVWRSVGIGGLLAMVSWTSCFLWVVIVEGVVFPGFGVSFHTLFMNVKKMSALASNRWMGLRWSTHFKEPHSLFFGGGVAVFFSFHISTWWRLFFSISHRYMVFDSLKKKTLEDEHFHQSFR